MRSQSFGGYSLYKSAKVIAVGRGVRHAVLKCWHPPLARSEFWQPLPKTGNRQVVVTARERHGRTFAFVVKREGEGVPIFRRQSRREQSSIPTSRVPGMFFMP